MSPMNRTELAQVIDHTQLSPTATRKDIATLCQEAKHHGFRGVCVGPRWVSLAADLLLDCPVKTVTVIGFPLGFETTAMKTQQTKAAIFDGADEIDLVADLGAIIEQDTRLLMHQFESVRKVCRQMRPPVTLKVIIESAALTRDQEALVCDVAQQLGVDCLKTSTGCHNAGGATAQDIQFMRTQAPACQVMASGGIRSLGQAQTMMDAGAARLGTSASVAIVNALPQGT
ncbi:MAG: deoxyribose-phosphate aldolase [Planctomycetes bacterium]|nr:deoxyribose-phosphate aldolase [Planctomycetota bacterium]